MEEGEGSWDDRTAAERRYVQIAPESVTNAAESIAISDLSGPVAKALAEDASYRLREIADLCSQLLRHSRKRKLTTDMFNRALKLKSASPVIGYKRPLLGTGTTTTETGLEFRLVPEAEIFVSHEVEVNLVAEALKFSGPQAELSLSVSASWLALQGKL